MSRRRVAVLISGNGSNLQALIDACAAPDFPAEIVQVIANRAEAYGLRRAQQAGISTRVIEHTRFPDRAAFDAALHEALLACNAELVCLAGFMRLLTQEMVAQWQGRMVNIHPSLLPAFAGINTHARALEAGVKITGCTVHFVVPEMDAGPIIIQAAVPVAAGDDSEALGARVLAQEHRIYPQALKWLAEGRIAMHGNEVRWLGGGPSPAACLINPPTD